MSRRKRTLIAIVVIESLLAGGWIWLHGMAMTSPHAAKDGGQVIGDPPHARGRILGGSA